MTEIKHRGHWWLAGEEEDKVAGVLEYDPVEGGKLELFDSFDSIDSDLYELKNVDKIIGRDKSGTYITLNNCNLRISDIGSAGPNHVVYPDQIFVGAGLPELEFDRIKIQYPNLAEWLGESSIKTNLSDDEDQTIPSTSVEFSDPINVELDQYSLEFKSTVSFGAGEEASIQYNEEALVEVTSEEQVLFLDIQDIIKSLQRYFSLSINEGIYPKSIQGIIERDDTQEIEGQELEMPDIVCDIYDHFPRYSKEAQDENESRLLFHSDNITLSDSIHDWVVHSREVSTFHELYFNTLYDPDMGIKYQFLSLCMAVESYFGYHYPDEQHMDDTEWEDLRENIFEAIPRDAEAADRLRGLIGNIGNEYSLKDKLRLITEDYSEVLSDYFDRSSTIEDINNTRNDIAHGFGGELPGSKTDPDDLIPLLVKTRIIVEICMFDTVGLSNREISTVIEKKYDMSKID
mgnify:CR=1 FL=1